MTWARFLVTGSGSMEARVQIEGLGTEFVSNPDMVKTTADGRARVYALQPMGKGIVFDESVNIPEAKLEAQGISLRLFETQDEEVSQAFAWRPSIELFVESTVTNDSGAVDYGKVYLMGGSAQITGGDVVHIGTEAMLVTGVDTGLNELTVTRAYWNTIAQKHWSNTGSFRPRILTNRPLRMRGRRVRVYMYGDGDDLQGDGTQVWLGTVTGDPECVDAGTAWLLQVASISRRLDGKLGGGLDSPLTPRGVYYSWRAPLCIDLKEVTTAGVVRDTGSGDEFPGAGVSGFFETQQAFVDALNTHLATLTSGWATTFEAEVVDDRWTIRVTTGASLDMLMMRFMSATDGVLNAEIVTSGGAGGRFPGTFYDTDGTPITALSGGQAIFGRWDDDRTDRVGARTVPRGYYGPTYLERFYREAPLNQTTNPAERIYMADAVPTDADAVTIEWGSGVTSEHQISDRNNTDNWINVRETNAEGGLYISQVYNARLVARMKLTRDLASGDLSTLRDAIVADGPVYCNAGTSPFLTSTDIADWSAVVSVAARYHWQQLRMWTLATALDLLDVLCADMQLLAIFPIVDSDGKIGVAKLDVPNATTADATTLDDELITVEWSSAARGEQTINRILVSANYDAREDEWKNEHTIFDETSYAQEHEYHDLEVKPRSHATRGDDAINPLELADALDPFTNIFGYPHDFVTIRLPWIYFSVRLGDVVRFSADHLPDLRNGVRPLDNWTGIVTSRKWECGEAHGTLKVLLPWQNVAGYTPNARVTSQANVTGNQWDITVNATLHAPTGHNIDEFFAAGYAVRIVQYDSESPTVITGTVDSVNTTTHVIRVTFTGAWTPGASTWELLFGNHADQIDAQKLYASIADADTLLGTESARLFAP
jgi:hypothetical protein